MNPALNAPYDDIDLQHAIAQEHWYVCGYKMNMKHPITEETHHLFHDADPSTPMFRVVVKANLSMPMADNLIASIAKSFAFLSVHNQIVGASHIFICAQVPRRARRGLQQPPAPRAPAAPQGVLGRRWTRLSPIPPPRQRPKLSSTNASGLRTLSSSLINKSEGKAGLAPSCQS